MGALTFDTHKYIKQLEAVGVTPEHAEAFVAVQRDILAETLESQLASKADIADLAKKMFEVDFELKTEIGLLRADMRELELRMTVKLGSISVVAIGLVAAIVKFIS